MSLCLLLSSPDSLPATITILSRAPDDEVATMTTHIPSLTLPAFAFEQPILAVLLPVALGTGVGFSTQREMNILLPIPLR